MLPAAGRARVCIEGVKPEIDGGRFPCKREIGDCVIVEADIFADGHDTLAAVLLWRQQGAAAWHEAPMRYLVNDRWRGEFEVSQLGSYEYSILAWVDSFMSWRSGLEKKAKAGQDVSVELLLGAGLLEAARQRDSLGLDNQQLTQWAAALRDPSLTQAARVHLALSDAVAQEMARRPDRRFATRYPKDLAVTVDPKRARFSAWYEMFPRSCSPEPGRHGTFVDCAARLPYVAEMGFDVLYLPPIHPIGRKFRKGKNNNPAGQPDDVGSPWAIGGPEGGHKAIHPEFGTLEDFKALVSVARHQGIEIALDIAFQCSPDHPYVTEHPEWFRHRPDGTVQYAENPPKKYEDIYPFDFETDAWESLWLELKSVFDYWIDQGVRIFRVDNPHTKSLPFWEWCIGAIKTQHPDALFLAEAFTRPKVMYRLAKLGFSQSYTYFAWRNLDWELTQYLTELTQTEAKEFFRPNFWPNTPDILTEFLQTGGLPAFRLRLGLAATMAANYGIYGPAFELGEARPRELGSEEYLDSEKYQLRHWNLDSPHSLKEYIGLVNRIRRENLALQRNDTLHFHRTDNEFLLCYSKRSQDGSNTIIVVANLSPHHVHSGWVTLDLKALGLPATEPYQVHDLLDDARFTWQGARNYVSLNPHVSPIHIFRAQQRVRSERDFDYYM